MEIYNDDIIDFISLANLPSLAPIDFFQHDSIVLLLYKDKCLFYDCNTKSTKTEVSACVIRRHVEILLIINMGNGFDLQVGRYELLASRSESFLLKGERVVLSYRPMPTMTFEKTDSRTLDSDDDRVYIS